MLSAEPLVGFFTQDTEWGRANRGPWGMACLVKRLASLTAVSFEVFSGGFKPVPPRDSQRGEHVGSRAPM